MEHKKRQYTLPEISGETYSYMLPEGISLVLEGGGTRGFYSAGVFEAFMDAGIMFPYIIGVSAGAANALTYLSGQRGRTRQIVKHFVAKPQYVGARNLLRHRSLFGYSYIFNEIPNQHLFWDKERFDQTPVRFLTGAFDCQVGETVWFEKDDLTEDFMAVQASCAVPLASPMFEFQGRKLLDGGITTPIPIEKAIQDGNRFHVVILTRNEGYQKKAASYSKLVRFYYRNYPKLAKAMMIRHELYNQQMALCQQLEKEGKALIIRPQKTLTVDRASQDTKKLLALYDEGHWEGIQAVKELRERLRQPI